MFLCFMGAWIVGEMAIFTIAKGIAYLIWRIRTRAIKEYTPLERPMELEAAKRILTSAGQDEYFEMALLSVKIGSVIQTIIFVLLMVRSFGIPQSAHEWWTSLPILVDILLFGAVLLISPIAAMKKVKEDALYQVDIYYETPEKTLARAREYVGTFNRFQFSMGRRPRLVTEKR